MSNQGKTVKAHYRGTLDDGTQFDSSYDRGEPIEFVARAGQIIKGFVAAVLDMEVGEKKTVHIPAAEAYGERSDDMILFFPADQVPDFEKIEVAISEAFRLHPGGGHNDRKRMHMSNQGKTVNAHYRGTLDDGTQFDSSYDRGEPIEFVAGAGQMIKGFDAAVLEMEVGEKKTVHIPAAEAYGERSDDMILFFPADQVPDFEKIEVGMKLFLQGPGGMPVPVTVVEVSPEGVKLDANHELAGKDLNFDIELVEVLD